MGIKAPYPPPSPYLLRVLMNIYYTITESGPENQNKNGLLGPTSIMVVYIYIWSLYGRYKEVPKP